MKKFVIVVLLFFIAFIKVSNSSAEIEPLDPGVRDSLLSRANELYDRKDTTALLQMLNESHLFIKTEVALMLGRLGMDGALPALRKYDREYSNFACAPSGQFGVAVILIENKTPESQKRALIAVATEAPVQMNHIFSVIDAAGGELSRFNGDDIISALNDVYTYGAQYTVLALKCRNLPKDEAIEKCIDVLETHETPLKAQAAQDLLIEYGMAVKPAVLALQDRVKRRIKSTDKPFTIPKTILSRCNDILESIEK
jgi:hypothetical protein